MKKILFVNNNMHIGGVQKSLVNLLHEIEHEYDITLFLFSMKGEYLEEIPKSVKVILCTSFFRYFGISQAESKKSRKEFIIRSLLAVLTKIFGRKAAIWIAGITQRKVESQYDVAISYLHSGSTKSFYGGCNEFVLKKVNAYKKITFLHGDYERCGANEKQTNDLYRKFDLVAACSEGCRKSFVSVIPSMAEKCVVVENCHNFNKIRQDANADTKEYEANEIHIVSIARLSREKSIDRALHAVSYIKTQGIKVRYHVVGDGIEHNNLERLTDKLGIRNCVTFYGNQKNPYGFLPNADLLLITSYHEAAPLVIDEARCFGVPVLSTKTVSADDMIVCRNLGWVCENEQESINLTLFNITKDARLLWQKKKELLLETVNNEKAVRAFHEIMR